MNRPENTKHDDMKPQDKIRKIATNEATTAAGNHARRALNATREQIDCEEFAAAIVDSIKENWQRACDAAIAAPNAGRLDAFKDVMREAGIAAAVRVFAAQPAAA